MSSKYRALIPAALVLPGLLFAATLTGPASHAGQEVMILQPVEDRDVPEGTQIPEWRLKEAEEKASEHKAQMRSLQAPQQQQQQAPQEAAPKPETDPQ